jgi:glycosyltransferase involved in cell wall biosynthesis
VLLWLAWLPSLVLVAPLAFLRKKLKGKHVFLFDRYSLGGAQRVHLDILDGIPEVEKLVLFTRKSPNEVMKGAFEAAPNTECLDIHFWCDNLVFRLFAVHYWAFYLNRHMGVKILSSNSTFFYDLLSWLRHDNERIELLHNFTYGKKGMEFFGLANYKYLDKRLVVDHYTAQNIRDQYAANYVDASFNERIEVIEPGVDIPEDAPTKDDRPLKVLYAGRGGAQKRVWLIDRIAAHCYKEAWAVKFHFAGDMEDDLSKDVRRQSVMHGQISEPALMKALYGECHALILTSAYEGFPMTIKEGMANGCIPVVTALPGNKTHLKDGENALLIDNVVEEEGVVREGIEHVHSLIRDLTFRKTLSDEVAKYARAAFDKKRFIEGYRRILY